MKVDIKLIKKQTDCLNYTYYDVVVRVKTLFHWKKLSGPLYTTRYLLNKNHSREIDEVGMLYRTGVMNKLHQPLGENVEIELTNEGTLYAGKWVLITRRKELPHRGEEYLTNDIEHMTEEELIIIATKLFRKFVACILGNIPVWRTLREKRDYENGNTRHMICE